MSETVEGFVPRVFRWSLRMASPFGTPSPRERPVDLNEVDHHRSLFCPRYDGCLEVAVLREWASWSCTRCGLFFTDSRGRSGSTRR